MITFTWDSTYESQPGQSIGRNMIDNELRKMRRGVREAMEREHNWGPYTEEDDGSHIRGKTTVLLEGNAATRDGLTNVKEGALYFLNSGGVKELYIYTSGAWVKATNIDHGSYSNLLSDSHLQYLKKNLDDTMTGALDMGANEIEISVAPAAGHDGYLVYGIHEGIVHPTLGSNSAVTDDAIENANVKIVAESYTGSLGAGATLRFWLNEEGLTFFPNFYASSSDVLVQISSDPIEWGFEIRNTSGGSVSYRVQWETMYNT